MAILLVIKIFLILNLNLKLEHLDVKKNEDLNQRIIEVIEFKNAIVGVSISDNKGKEIISIHGDRPFPMQSVFKFHIALVILAEVDKGVLDLNQEIEIKKEDLLPGLWSPIRQKYPSGTTLTLSEIIKYTVSLSDNVGCDVLIRLLGGPEVIDKYFKRNGFEKLSIKINEEEMQGNWELQFLNWTTPTAANKVLSEFYLNKRKLLSEQSHTFIWNVMRSTQTGQNRLRGGLPSDTIVAHKTGWSGTNRDTGITAAVNNIGIIFLPNGNYFFISVFVSESFEDMKTNEKIISNIANLAWNHFIDTSK